MSGIVYCREQYSVHKVLLVDFSSVCESVCDVTETYIRLNNLAAMKSGTLK